MMIPYRKNLAHKPNRRGETMDKVIEALENLVTEIVNDDGVSYEEALKRIQDALAAIS